MTKAIPVIQVPSRSEGDLTYSIVGPAGTLGQLHLTATEDPNVTVISLEIEDGHKVEVLKEDFTGQVTLLRIYATKLWPSL
jgi:hypothetical protein